MPLIIDENERFVWRRWAHCQAITAPARNGPELTAILGIAGRPEQFSAPVRCSSRP